MKTLMVLLLAVNLFSSGLSDYFLNKDKCDFIYSNKIYKSCYDYNYRGTKAVLYTVESNNNNRNNIKKRFGWKYPKGIPKEYLPYKKAYYKNKQHMDIGHLANDATFDYNKDILRLTYVLGVNGVPQDSSVNRYYWKRVEVYSRNISNIYGSIKVLDLIKYGKEKFSSTDMGLPTVFYKIFIINGKDRMCFKYVNDRSFYSRGDHPFRHIINCRKVIKDYNDKK